jgi:hypothetical protein
MHASPAAATLPPSTRYLPSLPAPGPSAAPRLCRALLRPLFGLRFGLRCCRMLVLHVPASRSKPKNASLEGGDASAEQG